MTHRKMGLLNWNPCDFNSGQSSLEANGVVKFGAARTRADACIERAVVEKDEVRCLTGSTSYYSYERFFLLYYKVNIFIHKLLAELYYA